jgi:hypothetical protein
MGFLLVVPACRSLPAASRAGVTALRPTQGETHYTLPDPSAPVKLPDRKIAVTDEHGGGMVVVLGEQESSAMAGPDKMGHMWPARSNNYFRLVVLPLIFCSAWMVAGGASSTVRINDSSDWWSLLNEKSSETIVNPQHREPAASNLEVLGVELKEEQLQKIVSKLGQATIVERGDGAASRSQICYASSLESGNTLLVFEQGEINSSFYLFADSVNWNGREYCVRTERVSRQLRTASGLGLGLNQQEVEAILGQPSSASKDKLVYEFETEKKTPPVEFEKLRKRYPQQTDKELRENFSNSTLSVHIEARFDPLGLHFFSASTSEVY